MGRLVRFHLHLYTDIGKVLRIARPPERPSAARLLTVPHLFGCLSRLVQAIVARALSWIQPCRSFSRTHLRGVKFSPSHPLDGWHSRMRLAWEGGSDCRARPVNFAPPYRADPHQAAPRHFRRRLGFTASAHALRRGSGRRRRLFRCRISPPGVEGPHHPVGRRQRT